MTAMNWTVANILGQLKVPNIPNLPTRVVAKR